MLLSEYKAYMDGHVYTECKGTKITSVELMAECSVTKLSDVPLPSVMHCSITVNKNLKSPPLWSLCW